jgi:ankyrin repeat protein
MRLFVFGYAIWGLMTAVAIADPAEERLKLAYQMQEAVLRTQSIDTVQALLKRGLDINAPIGCGTYSPLDGAVTTQNVEMLKFLLSHGAKPLARQLAHAAFSSDPEKALAMSNALLKAGVDPNTPGEELTALSGARYRQHQKVVALLLRQPGIKEE